MVSWIKAVFNPIETFKESRRNPSWLKAIAGFVLPSVIAGLALALIAFLLLSVVSLGLLALFAAPFGGEPSIPSSGFAAIGLIALAIAVIVPLAVLFAAFVWNGLTYLLCRLLKGKGSFKQQFHLASIAFATSCIVLLGLMVVSGLGGAAGLGAVLVSIGGSLWGLYGLVLWLLAVKEAHWP